MGRDRTVCVSALLIAVMLATATKCSAQLTAPELDRQRDSLRAALSIAQDSLRGALAKKAHLEQEGAKVLHDVEASKKRLENWPHIWPDSEAWEHATIPGAKGCIYLPTVWSQKGSGHDTVVPLSAGGANLIDCIDSIPSLFLSFRDAMERAAEQPIATIGLVLRGMVEAAKDVVEFGLDALKAARDFFIKGDRAKALRLVDRIYNFWVVQPLSDVFSPDTDCATKILAAIQLIPVAGEEERCVVVIRKEGESAMEAVASKEAERAAKTVIRKDEEKAGEQVAERYSKGELLTKLSTETAGKSESRSIAHKLGVYFRDLVASERWKSLEDSSYSNISVIEKPGGKHRTWRTMVKKTYDYLKKKAKGFVKDNVRDDVLQWTKDEYGRRFTRKDWLLQQADQVEFGQGTCNDEECTFVRLSMKNGGRTILMRDPGTKTWVLVSVS